MARIGVGGESAVNFLREPRQGSPERREVQRTAFHSDSKCDLGGGSGQRLSAGEQNRPGRDHAASRRHTPSEIQSGQRRIENAGAGHPRRSDFLAVHHTPRRSDRGDYGEVGSLGSGQAGTGDATSLCASLRYSSAAATPPWRWGTPARSNPISTPLRAPASIRSLKSPRCPIRKTLS